MRELPGIDLRVLADRPAAAEQQPDYSSDDGPNCRFSQFTTAQSG